MAFLPPNTYTNAAGQSIFTIDEFTQYQESVYLNGYKLIRTADYLVSNTDVNAEPGVYDTVTLITPLGDNSDTLEIVVYEETNVDSLSSKIDDLLTAAIGSWQWDKVSGIMTMYDSSGDEKFKFSVSDDADNATRERRSDLEI